MFITPDEMNTVVYQYQLEEITESDPDIVQLAIDAAVEEMKSYLNPTGQTRWRDGRPRYDIGAIFGAAGADRNAIVLELCKSIALYYVCRLANVDMIQERIKDRYDRAIDWLEKVSGVGKYADGPAIAPDLPIMVVTDDEVPESFRYGSREKFNHDF
ncbi:MAG: DUF1320 family protein [Flavobacteriales bacterium]|nr:DUF1320 family protein [Flavobacteriales bacterium]